MGEEQEADYYTVVQSARIARLWVGDAAQRI